MVACGVALDGTKFFSSGCYIAGIVGGHVDLMAHWGVQFSSLTPNARVEIHMKTKIVGSPNRRVKAVPLKGRRHQTKIVKGCSTKRAASTQAYLLPLISPPADSVGRQLSARQIPVGSFIRPISVYNFRSRYCKTQHHSLWTRCRIVV